MMRHASLQVKAGSAQGEDLGIHGGHWELFMLIRVGSKWEITVLKRELRRDQLLDVKYK